MDAQAITSYPAKAEESLAGAEREFVAGAHNNCANRCSSACFQAAVAALPRIGVGASPRDERWRHDAVQALFVRQLINRRQRIPTSFRDTRESGQRLRATADHKQDRVTVAQAARGLRRAREFVAAVRSSEVGDP